MRLIAKRELYNRLAGDALSESQYEQLLSQDSHLLFPQHRLVRFRKTVSSEFGTSQADYALIHHAYREWWIVEVELAHHSFSGHVFPQVQCLASAAYGEPEAVYLAAIDASLRLDALTEMMLGAQPRVLVIVNRERREWETALSIFGARVMVAEVYRSSMDAHALFVQGLLPDLTATLVSQCVPEPGLGKFLAVGSPAALVTKHGEMLDIEWEGSTTRWRRMDVKDKVWLYPIAGDGLPRGVVVELHRSESGSHFFKTRARQTRGG